VEEQGFKPGDSPPFASDPYLTEIMCVVVKTAGAYKLAGTSPGTFNYGISIKNTGTTKFSSIEIVRKSLILFHRYHDVR
jgi:hypothetical protein